MVFVAITASSSASTTPTVATLFIPNSALDENGAQLDIDQDDLGQDVTTYAITDEIETRRYNYSVQWIQVPDHRVLSITRFIRSKLTRLRRNTYQL
jgi:uncharacterized protein YccT (UPF0319 family)